MSEIIREETKEAVVEPRPRRRGSSGLTGAILLIGLGTVLLLQNLGLLEVDWGYLLRFWPVILILVGLDILLGRHSILGSLIVAAVGLMIVSGLIWLAAERGATTRTTPRLYYPAETSATREFEQELGGIEELEARLYLGVGPATVDSLSGSRYAVRGTYAISGEAESPVTYTVRGRRGYLTIDAESEGLFLDEIHISLTDSVPISLWVSTGIGPVTLDLRGLQIESLSVDAGLGPITLLLDEGNYDVEINGGIGNINIVLPRDAEASIVADEGLGSIDLPSRFERVEPGVWETPGYASSGGVNIYLSSGIGNVTVTEQ